MKKKSIDKGIFIIGDPHFRAKNFLEGEELIEKCTTLASKFKPSIIIVLGDVLDTHEVARNGPYKQAINFIDKLSSIAKTYVLIGNHDLVNQTQFLTDNHFFVPLKKWKNVNIVDTPIKVVFNDRTIVLCPYVQPGRFIEALDTLVDEEFDWRYEVSCIFAHQEIRGVVYGGKESENGDIWDGNYPPLICGHIHTECQVGPNVFYPGSSVQVAIDESPDKKVWILTFVDDDNRRTSVEALKIKKLNLNLKGRKEIVMKIEDVHSFDFDLCNKYYVKLKLQGTSEQFKIFRKSQLHAKIVGKSIKIGFDPIKNDEGAASIIGVKHENTGYTFEQNVRKILKNKSENIKNAYKDLKK